MTFNAAVFDIHPGDRRQLERIFAKETDIRKHRGELLSCETFGSIDSMLISPMKFDLFIVDASEKEDPYSYKTNLNLAGRIRDAGVKDAPIALLFREEVDMPAYCNIPGVTLYHKPVVSSFIKTLIDTAMEKKRALPSHYEIRGKDETWYVHIDEILYAIADAPYTDVYMTDDRMAHTLEDLPVTADYMKKEKHVVRLGKKYIINTHHIKEMTTLGVIMSDGKKISCTPVDMLKIRKAVKATSQSSVSNS